MKSKILKVTFLHSTRTRFIASLTLCFSGFVLADLRSEEAPHSSTSLKDEDIFGKQKIHDIHLKFTAGGLEIHGTCQRTQARAWENRSFLQGPEGGRNGIAAAFGITYNYV
jgi:hypothetical protein